MIRKAFRSKRSLQSWTRNLPVPDSYHTLPLWHIFLSVKGKHFLTSSTYGGIFEVTSTATFTQIFHMASFLFALQAGMLSCRYWVHIWKTKSRIVHWHSRVYSQKSLLDIYLQGFWQIRSQMFPGWRADMFLCHSNFICATIENGIQEKRDAAFLNEFLHWLN